MASTSVAEPLGRLDIAGALAAVIKESGWRQEDLAALLGWSQPTLSRILSGSRDLRLGEVRQIVSLLGIPPELVTLGGTTEGMVSPTRRRELGKFAALGAASIAFSGNTLKEQIEGVTRKYSAIEREHGGKPIYGTLIQHVTTWMKEVRSSGSPDAVSAFVELAGLTGYALYDMERHQRAMHYYSVALQAAYEVGNAALIGQVRALMPMVGTWNSRPNEGVAHCKAALTTLPLPPRERAMLLGRQARAVGLRNDSKAVYRLLDESADFLARADSRDSVIAYWSPVEAEGNAGIALKDIGDLDQAERHLRSAIDRAYASNRGTRDATLYLGVLSRLLLKKGNPEEAATVIGRVSVSQHIASDRTKRQLQLFLHRTRRIDSPAIRSINDRIRGELQKTLSPNQTATQ